MLDLNGLNDRQREAATSPHKTLVCLAGPGSGKTRMLTHRIAWLMEERGVHPGNILAVTFTNKAAGEMKERLEGLVGEQAEQINARTFHSWGARILREEIGTVAQILTRSGFIATTMDRQVLPVESSVDLKSDFSIYDTRDQKAVMSGVLKSLDLDSDQFPVKKAMNTISDWKNKGYLPGDAALLEMVDQWPESDRWRNIYVVYQSRLAAANALDFDDLLLYSRLLFEEDTATLRTYQDRYPYVLIDEYQDVNFTQFRLSILLTDHPRGNLTVVGDEDQSVYGFRGADFSLVQQLMALRAEHHLVLLEQNYRSTAEIVSAANTLINNNVARLTKNLWTALTGQGDKIPYVETEDGDAEAREIAYRIQAKLTEGYAPADIAILYRTNAQSRTLEMTLFQVGIPYQIAKGLAFFERKEVRDAIAYLRFLYNGDPLSFARIANTPPRGLREASVDVILKRAAGINLRDWLQT